NDAYCELHGERVCDRVVFGGRPDGSGRHRYSSCNTRWNAIAVSADSRRGSIEPPGLIGSSNRLGLPATAPAAWRCCRRSAPAAAPSFFVLNLLLGGQCDLWRLLWWLGSFGRV